MPSFQDSVVIFFIALLIFGPKKLPELARQLGKLMAEFRRASNEFRMQMEDELRVSEQAEQQKKIAAMEAAAPVTPAITAGGESAAGVENTGAENIAVTENTIAPPPAEDPIEVHPHMNPPEEFNPLPIATSGELNLMPPSTGLPIASSSVSQAFNSIPHIPDPEPALSTPSLEASTDDYAAQQIPNRTTTAHTAETTSAEPATEATLHG